AADFDGLKDKLSPASKDIYRQIRSVADRVEADKPISHQLKALKDLISNEERFSDLDLNL
ncbi:MAG: histidine ammonia-lyase, partial [Flavobacteriales bacterium]